MLISSSVCWAKPWIAMHKRWSLRAPDDNPVAPLSSQNRQSSPAQAKSAQARLAGEAKAREACTSSKEGVLPMLDFAELRRHIMHRWQIGLATLSSWLGAELVHSEPSRWILMLLRLGTPSIGTPRRSSPRIPAWKACLTLRFMSI